MFKKEYKMSKKAVLENRSFLIRMNPDKPIKPHSISFDMNKCVRIMTKNCDRRLIAERMKKVEKSK